MTPPRPAACRPLAALGVFWLAALACTRPTPNYCGGDGGAAKCVAPLVCSPRTLLCERPPDGGAGDGPDASDGLDAADARDGGDAADASPDVHKGCRTDPDCETSDAGPACVADGGQCVACTEKKHCATAAAPACTADHRCVECIVPGDCKPDAGSACTTDNRCVECIEPEDCKPATPVCSGNRCVECVVLGDCKDSARPICLANRCIQCTGNGDCKDPKRPICQAEQCRGCMADSECGPDPAVCLNHLDGRCATPDETIVVSNAAGCAMTATGPNAAIGTMTMPACSMQPLAQLVTMNRRVIVIRGTVQASSGPLPTIGGGPVSVVGQSTAVIAGGASPGLQITGADADVYVRSLALKSSTLAGIRATGGKVLLDGVVVDSNMGGGIFLDATSFTIANTTITNNGPAQEGATVWGGVYVSNVPATGPKLLQRVSIQNNKGPGLVCSAAVMGNGVLATGNSTLEIGSTCTVTSCASPSATCGAP